MYVVFKALYHWICFPAFAVQREAEYMKRYGWHVNLRRFRLLAKLRLHPYHADDLVDFSISCQFLMVPRARELRD